MYKNFLMVLESRGFFASCRAWRGSYSLQFSRSLVFGGLHNFTFKVKTKLRGAPELCLVREK